MLHESADEKWCVERRCVELWICRLRGNGDSGEGKCDDGAGKVESAKASEPASTSGERYL